MHGYRLRMPQNKQERDLKDGKSPRPAAAAGKLRIVGGLYRGRQLDYSGDVITRPMKDDIREAVFNLVGGWVPGKAAFDLFAGTGAMGLEAISRGASQAFLIERHFPTVKIIRQNIDSLDPQMNVTLAASDTFYWSRKFLKNPTHWPTEPWIVFCCPPYKLYVQSTGEILSLIQSFVDVAPDDSLIVIESDKRFDVQQLPQAARWAIRQYTPAVISVFKKF